MVLIFMNLLTGLTITQIDELKKTGTIIQAQKRVDDILSLSKVLPKTMIPKTLMSSKLNRPSKKVCVKVNDEKYYDYDPFHLFGTYHDLYHYNEIDGKHEAKIP